MCDTLMKSGKQKSFRLYNLFDFMQIVNAIFVENVALFLIERGFNKYVYLGIFYLQSILEITRKRNIYRRSCICKQND